MGRPWKEKNNDVSGKVKDAASTKNIGKSLQEESCWQLILKQVTLILSL